MPAPAPQPSEPISVIIADLFKALAHPARVRILELLGEGEWSVGAMRPSVGIEFSNLSQQLAVLRQAGLVTSRKAGPVVFYAIKDPLVIDLLAAVKTLLINSLTEARDLLSGLSAAASVP